jgi:hypothetical protein
MHWAARVGSSCGLVCASPNGATVMRHKLLQLLFLRLRCALSVFIRRNFVSVNLAPRVSQSETH